MLEEAKKALRVTVNDYDDEIARLLTAGANELTTLGVVLPGSVTITTDEYGVITDTSTLTDALAMQAIITYAALRFGNPPNYDKLLRAWEEQKGLLMHANAYTNYGGGVTA